MLVVGGSVITGRISVGLLFPVAELSGIVRESAASESGSVPSLE